MVLAAVFAVVGCKAEVESEYTITYDAAGHGTAPEAKTVEEGYKLTEEDLPALTADGFDFGGWKFNEKIVAAGEEVVSDMTLTAIWTEWGKVAKPAFSVASGELTKGTEIEITSATEGAAIYYTTDGTTPTASSTKYSAKIVINTATTIKAFAVKSEMKDSDVAEAAYTVYIAPVTNLTATCNASGTVKLTWTIPADADFAKVVITYGTDGKVEVLKTANPNNEATVTGLTDGTEYTFTVKAYDNSANASSGVNKKCTPFLGTGVNNVTNKGGLEGYTNQTQGAVIKESWMDTTSGYIKIGSNTIAKTSEVVVIPTGTVATVTMPDDSSWNIYCSGSDRYWKGVYLSGRKVKLDSFVMSQYEVTQKLYSEVMGENPSFSSNNPATGETQENRPVESVSWYKACAFCNELTKKTMTEADCVYYSDEKCATPYTKENANSNAAVYAAYNTETKKWTKKGYRLPTEAEWEFAARGGDPNALDGEYKSIWSYAYAGVQTEKEPDNFTSDDNDDKLAPYGWYVSNSSSKTHEVGLKEKNKLNLYDMSGNVGEWCYDKSKVTADSNDSAYTVNGYVQNPVGESSSHSRCCRGGNYVDTADGCSVSSRGNYIPSDCEDFHGFRLVRSTN